jgi:hypothetical protein
VKSTVVVESASPMDILVMETTEQVRRPSTVSAIGFAMPDLMTLYVGAQAPAPAWWKPTRSVTSNGCHFRWSDTLAESLATRLREKFCTISGIEKIFVKRDRDFYRVWTVIPDMDIDLEDRICDAQLAIIDLFPETKFDFSVVFRRERDCGWFAPYGAVQILPSS